jgi:hypothetical protein
VEFEQRLREINKAPKSKHKRCLTFYRRGSLSNICGARLGGSLLGQPAYDWMTLPRLCR